MSPRKSNTAMSPFTDAIATEVERLMAENGLSGASLAKEIGRSQNYVAMRLRREAAFSLNDLAPIADVFGVTAQSIVQAAENAERETLRQVADDGIPLTPRPRQQPQA